MQTKVFISWSGALSKKLANALRHWLPGALQFVKPYFSPEDIEKGAKWNSEIANELQGSHIGIICLTRDNTDKPWIIFEAGALSKSIDESRVCTILFDIDAANIKGPLASFQSTVFSREEMWRLFKTINSAGNDQALDAEILGSVFDTWWPKLDDEIRTILTSTIDGVHVEHRAESDKLDEILQLSRLISQKIVAQELIVENSRKMIEELKQIIIPSTSLTPHKGYLKISNEHNYVEIYPLFVDTRPLNGNKGKYRVLDYGAFGSVGNFLDNVFYIIRDENDDIEPFTYGKKWAVQTESGIILETHRAERKRDDRGLHEIEIYPGAKLLVIPV